MALAAIFLPGPPFVDSFENPGEGREREGRPHEEFKSELTAQLSLSGGRNDSINAELFCGL
jgi:hypothetical protein